MTQYVLCTPITQAALYFVLKPNTYALFLASNDDIASYTSLRQPIRVSVPPVSVHPCAQAMRAKRVRYQDSLYHSWHTFESEVFGQ